MTVISSQVSVSADDGLQSGLGSVSITGTSLLANTTESWIALGFRGINIPQDAGITAALLTVNVPSTTNDDPDFNIYAQESSNPAVIAVTASNISSNVLRPRTTAFVNWTATGVGTGSKSPGDLSALIQEILDGRPITGGVMLILDGLAACDFGITAFDGTPALAATLSITYSIPAFIIDSSLAFHGVQATWERVPKRKNNDATITYQPYALHTWDIPQMDATTFEALQELQGQVLTSLQTTDIDHRNRPVTYTDAEIIGVVSGRQEGRRITGARVTFRVDVS